MNVKDLLPIGSVVLLKEGQKKLMTYGVKQTDNSDGKTYDYIGVVYPEGTMGEGTQFLFNHEDIEEVFHRGYDDAERTEFMNNLADFYMRNPE